MSISSGEHLIEEKVCTSSNGDNSDTGGNHHEHAHKQTHFDDHSDEDTRRDSPPRLRIRLPEGKEVIPSRSEAASVETFQFKESALKEEVLDEAKETQKTEKPSIFSKIKKLLHSKSAWIRNNWDWAHFVPVIRGAVAAWLSLLLIIIQGAENIVGTASFLMLMVAFLAPPIEPTIGVIERELAILLTASAALAWAILGNRLANLARKNFVPDATIHDIFKAKYIEAGPSVIFAVFLLTGAGFFLYLRGRLGAGPFAVATVLACILLDVSCTVGPMYPYVNYKLGESVMIPIAFHSAVSMLVAIFVLPQTINSHYRIRFHGIFVPLSKALKLQPALLVSAPVSGKYDSAALKAQVTAAEKGLGALAAAGRLLKKDISYGRLGAGDFKHLHAITRRLTVRAHGMAFYFRITDTVKDLATVTVTPARSLASTPFMTPSPSVPSLHDMDPASVASSNVSFTSASTKRRRRRRANRSELFFDMHLRNAQTFFSHVRSPSSIFQDVVARAKENTVGVFESQRYLNLETKLVHRDADVHLARITALLGESAADLLGCCADTVDHIDAWFSRINSERFWALFRFWKRERPMTWEEGVRHHVDVRARLKRVLHEYRMVKRHAVLDPYRPFLDPVAHDHLALGEAPPHRDLFRCFVYQYHLIYFTEDLILMLDEMIRLETKRKKNRLWLPILPLHKMLSWSRWEAQEHDSNSNQDEDPNIIPGLEREQSPRRRDPDALPPRNAFEVFGGFMFRQISAMSHGNAVFGVKAGILTIILSLPNFLPSSSAFAYHNRSVWGIVLGQITLGRFRGDTAFGWTARIVATLSGGVVGITMWYTSTGLGHGNAYGLAAVNAVCLPILMFIRQYFPGPPMTVTIACLTTQLVIGYSWQDTHLPSQSYAGYGVEVAFKRFVAVSIGVTIAYIFSFFPPTTTIRKYLRMSYATTANQIGKLYCDIVSYATIRKGPMAEEIVKDLVAVRMKLNRTAEIKGNVHYEISIRGKWPKERYQAIHDIQMELAYLLSHLRSVTEHLETSWARAFLRRTRFLEPEFQGDVLAVISMISTPLPQITPCPLLDRFVINQHRGLNVTMENDDEADFGLPRTMTLETLENEQYLYFSVGVATAFGIVTRLDRLMLAAKELVGEQYQIQGMDMHRRET